MNNSPTPSGWPTRLDLARWAAVAVAFAGTVLLIVVQVHHDQKPNGTTLGMLVLAVVLLVGVLAPRAAARALKNVTKVKVAGVEISLEHERARAEAVARKLPRRDESVEVGPRPKSGDPAVDLLRVRDIARQRLRFMRIRLGWGPELDYPDILAWLHQRELLDTDEIRVLLDLLYEPVETWPREVREPYLDAMWPFVKRLAAVIFDRHVRGRLKAAGWKIADFDQPDDHRPDFLAFRDRESPVAVVAARVGRPQRSLEPARKRLAGELPDGATDRLIVVPRERDVPDDGRYETVRIVPLSDLLSEVIPYGQSLPPAGR